MATIRTFLDDKEAHMTAEQAQREAEEAQLEEKHILRQYECKQHTTEEEAR